VKFEVRRPPNRRARRAAKAKKAFPGTPDCCPKCKSPRVHIHGDPRQQVLRPPDSNLRQLPDRLGTDRRDSDLGPSDPERFVERALRQLCVPSRIARAGRHREVERTDRQASGRRHLPLPQGRADRSRERGRLCLPQTQTRKAAALPRLPQRARQMVGRCRARSIQGPGASTAMKISKGPSR